MKNITVQEAIPDPTRLQWDRALNTSLQLELLQLNALIATTVLSAEEDRDTWKGHPREVKFSVHRAYNFFSDRGIKDQKQQQITKLHAAPRVKTFIWLLNKNKLLTRDSLFKRGWITDQSCILCNRNHTETHQHLFSTCAFAKEIWIKAGRELLINTKLEADPIRIWEENNLHSNPTHNKRWGSFWAACCWEIWKARNASIFKNLRPNIDRTFLNAKLQAFEWERAFKHKGRRRTLPGRSTSNAA